MATYVNDLRLKEISTGDESGTWGTSTNTNLELIGEAFSFGTEAITTNADTHTTTIADGSTDPGRSIYLQYTGTLDSTCTITIGPNTVSKLWFIENATSGSQSIIIKQGSGATVTIRNGDVKAIYSDGAGSGGKMVDAFTDLHVNGLTSEVDGNTAALTVRSTDADANLGPLLTFDRKSASPADGDLTGKITFEAQNDASENTVYASMQSSIVDASDGTEDGALEINAKLAGTARSRMLMNATETVFNEGSQDLNFRIESDSNTHRFFLQDDNIIMGHSNGITVGGTGGALQVIGTTSATRAVSFTNFSADANSSTLRFGKSRGSSIGSNTVLQSGDNLGQIMFTGDDGGDLGSKAADILAEVDGTPGSDDMPGRIVFRTSPDGSNSVAEAMRINDSGKILINTTTDYGGKVNIARADNSVQLALVCTDADGGDGPILDFIRDSASPATVDDIAVINFKADDSDGNRDTYAQIEVFSPGVTSGSEQGRIKLNTCDGAAGLQNRIDCTTGETVFNNGSADIDFRVESDGNTHALFVEGSSSNVGIGTSSPTRALDVRSGTTSVVANFESSDSGAFIALQDSATSSATAVMIGAVGDVLRFDAGDIERLRIDSNGQILQGITTIPTGVQSSRQLISSSATGAEIIAYREDNAIAVNDFCGAFLIGHDDNSGTEDHFIGMWGEASSANGNMNLKFAAGRDTYETGGSHMMISSAGDLLVGTTASQGLVTIRPAGGGSSSVGYSVRPNTDTCTAVNFRNAAGTQIGHISTTASATSYNTSSDQRLKENIEDADDTGSKVDAIQVRKFDWIVDGSHQDYGMVAQELQAVAPEVVSEPEDPDEMMGVDYSKLVPMLIKEIQSLRARVNALEAE